MPLTSLVAVQSNIHPGTVLPGQVTGWASGVGAAEYASQRGTPVIHRILCLAGVTGFCGERVSAGVPNGIFYRGNRRTGLPD